MSSPPTSGLPGDKTVPDRSAVSTVQPVILTADQDVLIGFYTELFGAEEIFRTPTKGPAFYIGLRIGDSDLGLVARTDLGDREAPRILLSIGVEDVDETLSRVEALGGTVSSGANDMPWGQRVAHVLDPDGNPVNLSQPIPAR
jgi:predicted enzyme related to lactoylglutathione lyase